LVPGAKHPGLALRRFPASIETPKTNFARLLHQKLVDKFFYWSRPVINPREIFNDIVDKLTVRIADEKIQIEYEFAIGIEIRNFPEDMAPINDNK
jgi:hypothetical protein